MKRPITPAPQTDEPAGYWQRSQRPLQALLYLLPLLFLYEAGTLVYATDPRTGVVTLIYARSLLHDFFTWLGVTGYYLPGIIVVAVLLTWHVVRRDPWRIEPGRLYAAMWAESTLLALPLFIFALVLFRHPLIQSALTATGPDGLPPMLAEVAAGQAQQTAGWQAQLVFSIGAGIYEELLFRLIAIALLHLLLVDVLALPERPSAIAAVLISAFAFALYHFSSANPFTPGRCLFYTGAGIYLAGVYVLRGFGIVAGTHAVYDVMVTLARYT